METKDRRTIIEAATKRKRDEVAGLWRKGRGKTMTDQRNVNIPPRYLRVHKTQQDSIQKIGMNFNKKEMNGRGFHR